MLQGSDADRNIGSDRSVPAAVVARRLAPRCRVTPGTPCRTTKGPRRAAGTMFSRRKLGNPWLDPRVRA